MNYQYRDIQPVSYRVDRLSIYPVHHSFMPVCSYDEEVGIGIFYHFRYFFVPVSKTKAALYP